MTSRDVVSLKGMRFHTRVGVLPHEAQLPQPVEVDLSVAVEASVRPPHVVDYVALYAAVSGVMGAQHIAYLEEAAERVAVAALSVLGVRSATVSVRKPHVPLPGPVEFAEVTITRERMDDIAFVALGSNVGDRGRHLGDALARIAEIDGVTIVAASAVEETAPLGGLHQDPYLNQMIALRTTLAPPALLDALHAVERIGGRVRTERWGPRTIDLDIVSYAHTTWDSPELHVPHREIDNRDFWHVSLPNSQR